MWHVADRSEHRQHLPLPPPSPPAPSFPWLPITRSDMSRTLTKQKKTIPSQLLIALPYVTLSGEERGGKLPDKNIHMDDTKSAKTGTDRKKKRKAPDPQPGQCNTLSEPAKQRKACRTLRLCLLSTENNAFERRGQGLMWHSRAFPRKKHTAFDSQRARGNGHGGPVCRGSGGLTMTRHMKGRGLTRRQRGNAKKKRKEKPYLVLIYHFKGLFHHFHINTV